MRWLCGHVTTSGRKARAARADQNSGARVWPEGVTVNAISPGTIDPRGDIRRWRPRMAIAGEEIPSGRIGTAAEIAAVCGLLCSAAGRSEGADDRVNAGLYVSLLPLPRAASLPSPPARERSDSL